MIFYVVIAFIVTILLLGVAIVFISVIFGGLSYEDVEDHHDVGEGHFNSRDDPDGRK